MTLNIGPKSKAHVQNHYFHLFVIEELTITNKFHMYHVCYSHRFSCVLVNGSASKVLRKSK